jgi:hypothetical protein
MLPELEARGGFTRDKSDTGGMKVKSGWAVSGWRAVPVIGSVLGIFDLLRNWIFRGEEARLAKRQFVGPFGRQGRLAPVEGRPMTPDDMYQQTLVPNRFAQHGARPRGAARRGTRQRGMMQNRAGARAFTAQRSARKGALKQAA